MERFGEESREKLQIRTTINMPAKTTKKTTTKPTKGVTKPKVTKAKPLPKNVRAQPSRTPSPLRTPSPSPSRSPSPSPTPPHSPSPPRKGTRRTSLTEITTEPEDLCCAEEAFTVDLDNEIAKKSFFFDVIHDVRQHFIDNFLTHFRKAFLQVGLTKLPGGLVNLQAQFIRGWLRPGRKPPLIPSVLIRRP